jgi:transcriptional regulator with XRE-family HTH domain
MVDRHSSQKDGTTPLPGADTPLVDMAALGERLRRLRQWKRYSQSVLAQRAGVDPMVISRLEHQQKPRLEVETAAKLARAFRWTLDQLCGLAPAPPIPETPPARRYTPMDDGQPAWLHTGARTSLEDKRLAAHILVWHSRGATYRVIAHTLTTWAIPSSRRDGVWTPECVSAHRFPYGPWRAWRGGKKALRAFVAQYGPGAEIPNGSRAGGGALGAPRWS